MDGTDDILITDHELLVLMAGWIKDIRDVLVQTVPNEPADEGCQHPEDRRVSMATPVRPDYWICSICKHEHQGIVHN